MPTPALTTLDDDRTLLAEKLNQAHCILSELEIDVWLILVRESGGAGDFAPPNMLGLGLTSPGAVLIARGGERVAMVCERDEGAVRAMGAWPAVIPFVRSPREPLVEMMRRLDPARIAISTPRDDAKADGPGDEVRHFPREHLEGTSYGRRLIGAEAIVEALRGRKSASEIIRIRDAIAVAERMLEGVGRFVRVGMTEREAAVWLHGEVARRGVAPAWDAATCPIVNSGPASNVGHAVPSDLAIEPGHVLHVDFGISRAGYCSDLQRCWYAPRAGESEPPAAARRALGTIVEAIRAAMAVLRPGVAGWEVDAAARDVLTRAGYPEHPHSTGHQVGRSVHDGGGVLGPRWERYGRAPFRPVEEGNVFALELGIERVGDHGYMGLEEMVLVTRCGCEFLSTPQVELRLIGG